FIVARRSNVPPVACFVCLPYFRKDLRQLRRILRIVGTMCQWSEEGDSPFVPTQGSLSRCQLAPPRSAWKPWLAGLEYLPRVFELPLSHPHAEEGACVLVPAQGGLHHRQMALRCRITQQPGVGCFEQLTGAFELVLSQPHQTLLDIQPRHRKG